MTGCPSLLRQALFFPTPDFPAPERRNPLSGVAGATPILFLLAAMMASVAGAMPAVRLGSIDTAQAPVLDGRLDDPVWQQTPPLGGLQQVSPEPGAEPSVATEIRMTHDGAVLYIAIRALEKAGYQRSARQRRRDALLDGDDHFSVVIDPARGGRNGYLFSVNANGAQFDALIFDSAEPRPDWDAIWDARVHADESGWSAELAIPLNSLTLNGTGSWGVNIERYLGSSGERLRWRGALPDRAVSALRIAGELQGVPSAAGGHGLRVKPSLRLQRSEQPEQSETRLEPGLDLFWRMRPDTTATLTLNSDFAEAEADQRQVNLTRYPLFFPEKREFFLQDAGVFAFGGRQTNLLPFFSRRIGLAADGTLLALEAGFKLSHESRDVDAGLLAVRVEEGPHSEATSMGVGRAAVRTGAYSRIGVIGTSGNPAGTGGSSLWGVDWQYRNPQFLPDRNLAVDLWTQTSANPELGSGSARGVFVDWSNLGWTGNVGIHRVDAAFEPALGFLVESGVRQSQGELGYWWRTADGDEWIPQLDWERSDGIHDARLYQLINPEIYIGNAREDYVMPELYFERETLIEDFEILPGLTVPAGDYRYDSALVYIGVSASRPLSGEFSVRWGEFYDGDREDYALSLALRPEPGWGVTLRAERTDLHLPAGNARVHLAALGLEMTPTARIFASTLLQWDSVSDELGVNLRLRWTLAPGQDIYLSLNRLFLNEDEKFSTSAREDIVKVVWNWMF